MAGEGGAWPAGRSLAGRGPRADPPPAPTQDDMQVVIGQQLRSQRQKELNAAAQAQSPRRAAPRFSLRDGFLGNLFRRT